MKRPLNADGDTDDDVLHTHDLTRGKTTNLGEAIIGPVCLQSQILARSEKWLAFGFGTVRIHDFEAGETTDLDLALYNCSGNLASSCGREPDGSDDAVISRDWLAVKVDARKPEERSRGEEFSLFHLVDLEGIANLPRFLRGDCNADGVTKGSITDAAFLLTYNFAGGAAPECLAACDANGDGAVNVTDAVHLLLHNFVGGPPPALPFPRCQRSLTATAAELGCETPHDCQ